MTGRICCIIISLLFLADTYAVNFFTQAFDYIVKNANSDSGNNQRSMHYHNNGNRPFSQQQQAPVFMHNNGNNRGFIPINNNTTSVIKTVCISYDGTQIARIIKSGNIERVFVRNSQNIEQNVLTISESIEKISFAGSNFIVCTIKNRNNLCYLRIINLFNRGYHNLMPINNATHIDVIPPKNSDESIYTISYNGRYSTHSVNLKTGQMLSIADSNVRPVVDKNLNVRIFYKLSTSILGTTSGFDVFAIPEGGTDINALQIDHINDISKEMYISAAGNFCYKIALQEDNSLVITGINLDDNSRIDAGSISGVTSLGDCRINLDTNGHPIFVTIGSGQEMKSFPLVTDVQTHLDAIDRQFGGIGWCRISYTADNSVWILCAYTQPNSRYFIYDTRNGGISEIPVDGRQMRNSFTTHTVVQQPSQPLGIQVL